MKDLHIDLCNANDGKIPPDLTIDDAIMMIELDEYNWEKYLAIKNQNKDEKEQQKKVIELLSEIVEQGTDLSWQTAEKAEMLLKELNQNKDE